MNISLKRGLQFKRHIDDHKQQVKHPTNKTHSVLHQNTITGLFQGECNGYTQVMVDTKLTLGTDHGAVPWHRQRPQLNARPVHVIVLVEKVAMAQGFLRELRFSHVDIIPPASYTHSFVLLAIRSQQPTQP
jgi:hypothetical protein